MMMPRIEDRTWRIATAQATPDARWRLGSPRDPRPSIPDFRSSILYPRPRRQAFTLLELGVLIVILGILVSIFIPYVRSVREVNHRARCADNLRQLKVALNAYGSANGNEYPSVRHEEGKPGYVAFTGSGAVADPFAVESAVKPNDVTASLWLLVRQGFASPAIFVCPSTGASPQTVGGGEVAAGNFRSVGQLGYSYASPFSVLPDYHLNSDRLRSEFAVMADMNPGAGDGDDVAGPAADAPAVARSRGNSRNHGKAGQNVLYGDGHVEFRTTHYCGFGDDNVYTALSPHPIPAGQQPPPNQNGVLGREIGPAWYSDSYLVPTVRD